MKSREKAKSAKRTVAPSSSSSSTTLCSSTPSRPPEDSSDDDHVIVAIDPTIPKPRRNQTRAEMWEEINAQTLPADTTPRDSKEFKREAILLGLINSEPPGADTLMSFVRKVMEIQKTTKNYIFSGNSEMNIV